MELLLEKSERQVSRQETLDIFIPNRTQTAVETEEIVAQVSWRFATTIKVMRCVFRERHSEYAGKIVQTSHSSAG